MSEGFLASSIESLEDVFPIFTWRDLEPDLPDTELVQGVAEDYGLVVEVYRGVEEDTEYYALAYWRPIDDEDSPLLGDDGFAIPATPMDAKMLTEVEDSPDLIDGEVDFWGQIRVKAPERTMSGEEVVFRALANMVGTSGMMLHLIKTQGQQIDAMLDEASLKIPGVENAESDAVFTGEFGDGVAASVGADTLMGDKLDEHLTEAHEALSGYLKNLKWEKTAVLVRGEGESVKFAVIPSPDWDPKGDDAPQWIGLVDCFVKGELGDTGLSGHTPPGGFFNDPVEAANAAFSSIDEQVDSFIDNMTTLRDDVIKPMGKRFSIRLVTDDDE